MGTQPVSMYPHWTERWDGEDKTSWLWVAQKGGQGAVDISGSSYKQEGICLKCSLVNHIQKDLFR